MALVLPVVATAEQKLDLGPFEVHYSVFQTSFLKPEIAERYGIVRGRDRALLNISVLDGRAQPPAATLASLQASVMNLLGQITPLKFSEVREGSAVYYLANVKHTDREVLRFKVDITVAGEHLGRLEFQQKMYWDGR